MAKRYALKGVNDDRSECVVCGKIELKRVMWLVELDAEGNEIGDPLHCGTTCGAKLMQRKVSVVNKAVNSFGKKLYDHREWMWYQSEWGKRHNEELEANRGQNYRQRRESGLMDRLTQYRKDFDAWFTTQPISFEIEQ